MRPTIRYPLAFRALTALVLMSFVQGCMHWQSVAVQPESLAPGGETVRTQLDSGQVVTLYQAFIERDSLLHADGIGLPVETVRRMDVRRTDAVATVFMFGAVVAVVATYHALSKGLDFSGWGAP